MNVKIQGKIVPVSQVTGKSLFAARQIKLYRRPDSSEVVYTVPYGKNVGTVYSYIVRTPELWWMFYDQNGKPYYAKHEDGAFSWTALQQQGTKTAEDIVKDQQPKTVVDSIVEGLGGILKPVIIAVAVYYGAKALQGGK